MQAACVEPSFACLAAKVCPDGAAWMSGQSSISHWQNGRLQQLQRTRPSTGKSWTAGCSQERGWIKEEESEEGRNKLQKVSWDSEWLSHHLLSCSPPSLSWVYPFHVFLSAGSHTQITSLNPTRGENTTCFQTTLLLSSRDKMYCSLFFFFPLST